MTSAMIGGLFTLAYIAFAIPAAIFLVRAYSRSKMSGFMWLFFAVIVWPFLAHIMNLLLPMLAARSGYPLNTILMFNLGMTVVGGILLLVSAVILDRELGERIVAAQRVNAAPGSAGSPTG